jgi:hypothetical protein
VPSSMDCYLVCALFHHRLLSVDLGRLDVSHKRSVWTGYRYLCPVSIEATRSNKSGLDKSIIKSATTQVRPQCVDQGIKRRCHRRAGLSWTWSTLLPRALGRNAWLWARSVPRPPLSDVSADRGSLCLLKCRASLSNRTRFDFGLMTSGYTMSSYHSELKRSL